jgi:phosphopantothenoylcysteine decarboxylase/phosphopantothenate--cysteine ligase
MGYALARAARDAGAAVTLVSGPVALSAPEGVETILVETATEMHEAVLSRVQKASIFIGCAAVADYRLDKPSTQKIKKQADSMRLDLIKNPDILAEVAVLPDAPFTVGFAAETDNLLQHAREKLLRKNLDMIAANQVGKQQGFEQDENALTVIWRDGQQELPTTSKDKLARELLQIIAQHLSTKTKPAKNEKRSTKNT